MQLEGFLARKNARVLYKRKNPVVGSRELFCGLHAAVLGGARDQICKKTSDVGCSVSLVGWLVLQAQLSRARWKS